MNVHIRAALERCLSKGLAFAAFRVPGGPVQLWVQTDAVIEEVSLDLLAKLKDRFVMAPYDLGAGKLLALRPDLQWSFGDGEVDLDPLERCKGAALTPSGIHFDDVDDNAKERFMEAVIKAKEAFASGRAEKVVLSRSLTVPCGSELLPWLFTDALEQRPGALVVLLNTAPTGTWLGASPERLLHANDEQVTADALAGTMPSSIAPKDPGRWGIKERDEQAMVTRTILNTFLETGLETMSVRGPEVVEAGPVAHLRCTISAQLAGRSLAGLVAALHPTPAVCGLPREEAKAFIAKHELQDRQLYAGFWGPWRNDRRTELYVNIRCLRSVQDHVIIHVGAGITAGSDPEREWQETENKARTWTQPIEALRRGRVS
jgi:isochorismate synthase